jgi:hypothetical protein
MVRSVRSSVVSHLLLISRQISISSSPAYKASSPYLTPITQTMLPPPHLDDLSLTFAIPESGASPFSTSVVGNNRSTRLDLQQHMSVLDVPIRLTTGLGKCCGRFMDTYHGEPLVDQNTLDIYQIPVRPRQRWLTYRR